MGLSFQDDSELVSVAGSLQFNVSQERRRNPVEISDISRSDSIVVEQEGREDDSGSIQLVEMNL